MVESHQQTSSYLVQRNGTILLLILVIAAYVSGLNAPFIFDDYFSVVNNPNIRSVSGIFLRSNESPVAGRPVVALSLAVNYAIGGLSPFTYHALNLIIHLANTLLVCWIAGQIFSRIPLKVARPVIAGYMVAALWAVHPLLTDAVQYITQRTELLVSLFYLSTIACVIRSWDTIGRQSKQWQLRAIIACALGMASKEVMVTAPIMVMLMDRTFAAGSFRSAWAKRRFLYVGLITTWLILTGLVFTSSRTNSVGTHLGVSSATYFLIQLKAIAYYLYLSFWPSPLSITYFIDPAQVRPFSASAVFTLILAGTTLYGTIKRTAYGFAGCWFFGILAPTSSFLPIVSEMIAERRMYLPLVAVISVVVASCDLIAGRLKASRQIVYIAGSVIAVALAAATIARVQLFRNPVDLWRQAYEQYPKSPLARTSLAATLVRNGDVRAAIPYFESVVVDHPEYAEAFAGLGNAYGRNGQYTQAKESLEKALALQPGLANARFDLALCLIKLGQYREAKEHLDILIKMRPDDPKVREALQFVSARA